SPGEKEGAWTTRTRVDVAPPSSLVALETAPVAVLYGPRTVSSGEAVAVAFRGRPRTRAFGQSTGGVTTGNADSPLPDGGILFLTTTVYADRTGHEYGGKMDPDEAVPGAPNAASQDAVVDAATRWLKKESCGGQP